MVAAAMIPVSILLWSRFISPTRIAFVNYQTTVLGQISKANQGSHVKLYELPAEKLGNAKDFDLVLVNGMGLRITEHQREMLEKAAESGAKVMTTMATNPANDICSIEDGQYETIKGYLAGGRKNYTNMLRYIRKEIDGKSFGTEVPEEPVIPSAGLLFHTDPDSEGDELTFGSVAEYGKFLDRNGLSGKGKPSVVITGQMGDPSVLADAFENKGYTVYPVTSLVKFIKAGHIDSIAPDAVINLAHGRLGDYATGYLSRRNIPLFSPLNVNVRHEEWEKDEMGMNGGFMSQSIVTPEIDGAIRPYALFANFTGNDGLQYCEPVPERLETFIETVGRYISLAEKDNSDKKIAIVYFKGPGQNGLTAQGMEVVPSLYNFLVSLRDAGYNVEGLPSSAEELGKTIAGQGSVFGTYAEGAISDFIAKGNPELIDAGTYGRWAKESFTVKAMEEALEANGEFPGNYMTTDDGRLAVARIVFGNIAILPQPAAGGGTDEFQMVHGTKTAPPYSYTAPYLWIRHGFKADAMIHFGTHGSLEFTPGKQTALCSSDWPDALVGPVPHFYLYTIGNIGECMMAKRRSYAGITSYLTAPFMESGVRGIYSELEASIMEYNRLRSEDNPDRKKTDEASAKVKENTLKLGIHRELGLDSLPESLYTASEIEKIEQFAEELASEKITGRYYTLGVPYDSERIASSVYAMSTDPIAYGLYNLDRLRGNVQEKYGSGYLFRKHYAEPARKTIGRILADPSASSDETVCRMAGISMQDLEEARKTVEASDSPKDMMSMMMQMAADSASLAKMEKALSGKDSSAEGHAGSRRAVPSGTGDMMKISGMLAENRKEIPAEELAEARAIVEIDNAVKNARRYRKALLESPSAEIRSLLNALDGGYTSPSSGGDPIANPDALPTGRNLYSVNLENTPTRKAWEKGKELAEKTIALYRERHNDSIPRKVSYTLWSSEFIETEGATVAQVLYMLGVEPVYDSFGRVTDIRLIPSEKLGRPRIDVVVQTSGQLRDLAASRLFLISRAVEMAASAKDDIYGNLVASGIVETERILVEKGLTPKEARRISAHRVFGGMNGSYGTGIQGMVQAGDRWNDEKEIASVYLNNMGAFYGSEEEWENFSRFAFEAALANTDAVIQPRQSNTWGALSLDHVYEFMGGLNLAVRNVTGKDPDAYFSDYRNRNRARIQNLKEAVGVESRTTVLNPEYIKEKMKGGNSEAGSFAEIIENTYGWNVMKPEAIDDELWNDIYSTYVEDRNSLGIRKYFEEKNPAALQQMSAVMLETARKGLWKASGTQIRELSELHAELVRDFGASCSPSVCDNPTLRRYIADNAGKENAEAYLKNVQKAREATASDGKSMVMKKEEISDRQDSRKNLVSNIAAAAVVTGVMVAMAIGMRNRRKKQNTDRWKH